MQAEELDRLLPEHQDQAVRNSIILGEREEFYSVRCIIQDRFAHAWVEQARADRAAVQYWNVYDSFRRRMGQRA